MKQKYILLALVAFFSFKGISQSYTVNPIPFQQYTGNLANLPTIDDMNSPLISLPFSFEFYGNSSYPKNLMNFIGINIIEDAETQNLTNLKKILENQ